MRAKIRVQNAVLTEQDSELPQLMGFFKLGDMGLSRCADA